MSSYLVLSFGVLWELFEFGLDVAAEETGMTMPLAQRGLDDPVRNLMFNSLDAVVVATFGLVYLSGLVETIGEFTRARMNGASISVDQLVKVL